MMDSATRDEAHFGRVMRCFVERPANGDALLRDAVERSPDGAALIAGDLRLSYRELDDQLSRLAGVWASIGLRKGDRVALLLSNRPEFLLSTLATALLGFIVVSINVRQRRPEIPYMLDHSQAKALIFEHELAAEISDAPELPELSFSFCVDGDCQGADSFDDLLRPPPLEIADWPDEDDAFCILYTSGTTGRPKGAVLRQLDAVHSVLHYEMALDLHQGDVAAPAVSASHVTGIVAILLTAVRVASAVVVMPAFKARDFLAFVERERVGYTLMVPAMYYLCLLAPEFATVDLSNWRVGRFGGTLIPQATIAALHQAVPGLRLSSICGATETTYPVPTLGAFADRMIAPAASSFLLSDAMSFDDGTAYGMACGTAYQALVQRGSLRAGDAVLVLGAGGGVGFASGTISSLPANLALIKNAAIVGVFWGTWSDREPEANRANFAALPRPYEDGGLKPADHRRNSASRYAGNRVSPY